MFLALLLLVLTAPVILVLAVLVRLTSPGPAFFRQVRVGLTGRQFRILKFRTMTPDAEQRLADDPALREAYIAGHFKVPAHLDPRLTSIGRFMRRSSLDELPQLWNVLLGHMSMVGPRPVVPDEMRLYGDLAPVYAQVRPGLTGYWQVNGRSHVTGSNRIALEYFYLTHRTFRLDLLILLRTVPAVFRYRDAQ